jgi:hypothetical protein
MLKRPLYFLPFLLVSTTTPTNYDYPISTIVIVDYTLVYTFTPTKVSLHETFYYRPRAPRKQRNEKHVSGWYCRRVLTHIPAQFISIHSRAHLDTLILLRLYQHLDLYYVKKRNKVTT